MGYPAVTYSFSNASTADATQVNQNFTDLINGASDGTKNYNISALTAAGATVLNGAVTLGASTSNLIVFNGAVNSDVPINTNTTYNIGAATKGVLSVYIGGSSTYTVRLIAGTQSASYTLTFPTAVPAGNAYALESTTGGVLSFANRRITPTVSIATAASHSGGMSANSSGTYTTPAGVLYIEIIMAGGGGGGGGGGAGGSTDGGNGGDTTWNTTLLVAGKGSLGAKNAGAAGAGGTNSSTSGPIIVLDAPGGAGSGPYISLLGEYCTGGVGGNNWCGGSGTSNADAAANSGGGGGGGAFSGAGNTGSGGGAGGVLIATIASPSATYTYAVGAAGASGAGSGGGGSNGTNGAAGRIVVKEYYQ